MAGRYPAGETCLWRLERKRHVETWDSGIGAELGGGRWNTKGRAAVYGSLDPSTAILEVAAHKGFKALDTIPHLLICARILDHSRIHEVTPASLPNPNWLMPGSPGQGQQAHGDSLLEQHPFIMVPSTVSRYSWNIVMNPVTAQGLFELVLKEPFAFDTRLNPPHAPGVS
jgi:RES domain-containing protein